MDLERKRAVVVSPVPGGKRQKISRDVGPPSVLQRLQTVGYYVSAVPIVSLQLRKDAINAIQNAPELIKPSIGGMSCSGFGALGGASAFHNIPARRIRAIVHYHVSHNFGIPITWFSHSICDRMGAQLTTKPRAAESWHRDVTPGLTGGGYLCLGGFVNLGVHPQYFVCAPGNIGTRVGTGFDKIPKSETATLNSQQVSVCVPPGHCLWFDQLLAHKVKSGKPKSIAFRQYISVLLSDRCYSPLPHVEAMGWYGIEDATTDQKSLHLPSGQFGHYLCPKLYNVNHTHLAAAQAARLRPELRRTTARGNETCKIFAPSLRELGSLYAPYDPEDIAILRPQHIGA